MARTTGNVNSLAIVHIDELLETSTPYGDNSENKHQWLDSKGWIHRKAILQTINGGIYETILNIARANDGRYILYSLSNTKRIDEGAVPSAAKGGAARTLSTDSDNRVSQNNPVVNSNSMQNSKNNSQNGNLGERKSLQNVNPDIYTDNFKKYFGDWENDPKNASKVVNADGTPKVMYHASPA